MTPEQIMEHIDDPETFRKLVIAELQERYQTAWDEFWRERDLDILYGIPRKYTIRDIVPYK